MENSDFEKYKSSGKNAEEILAENSDSSLLYALSPMRLNLLSWIDYKGKKVLLAGDKENVLTSMLKEKKIDAVSDNDSGAGINGVKYDVIIALGAAVHKLKELRKHLSDAGQIILIANNKLAVSKLSGKKNTISNYEMSDNIDLDCFMSEDNRFTESELINLIKENKMIPEDTYYPVPDMLYPRMIYHKEHVPEQGFFEIPTPEYTSNRISFFDEVQFMDQAGKEGRVTNFANSIMIVAGSDTEGSRNSGSDSYKKKDSDTQPDRKVIYARFNSERLKRFRTDTFIYETPEGIDVVKRAACPEAEKHLEKMIKNHEKLSKIGNAFRLADIRKDSDGIHFEYIKGRSLSSILGDLEKQDLKSLTAKIDEYVSPMFEGTIEAGATDSSNDTGFYNLDMIPSNVIITPEGESVLIDYEWVFDKDEANEAGLEINDRFIRYRTLRFLYQDNKNKCFKGITFSQFMNSVGINDSEAERFSELEDRFQQYVYGQDWKGMYTRGYLKQVMRIEDLEDVLSDKLRHIEALEQQRRKYKKLLMAGAVASGLIILVLIFLLLRK